jgi:predicted esterase
LPPANPVEHHLEVRRTARYFALGNAISPREVWLVLHGHGQLARAFIRYFSDLDDGTRLIVAPEALNRYYLVSADSAPAAERPVGATWMTREDRLAEIEDYVEYLDALHAAVTAQLTGTPPRIRVVGFSQGAATASRWCAFGSSRVDDWILWGGTTPPDLDLARLRKALDSRRLTLVVGDRDKYISGDSLAAERTRLTDAGIPHEAITFDGGHAISREVLARLA